MAEKIPFKHVPKQGADDKRAITLTLAETLSGDMLPFQMTYNRQNKPHITNCQIF